MFLVVDIFITSIIRLQRSNQMTPFGYLDSKTFQFDTKDLCKLNCYVNETWPWYIQAGKHNRIHCICPRRLWCSNQEMWVLVILMSIVNNTMSQYNYPEDRDKCNHFSLAGYTYPRWKADRWYQPMPSSGDDINDKHIQNDTCWISTNNAYLVPFLKSLKPNIFNHCGLTVIYNSDNIRSSITMINWLRSGSLSLASNKAFI